MHYKLTDQNESFTLLETDDIEFKKLVVDSLSAFVDNYKFTPQFRAGIWDGKKHFYKIQGNGDIIFPKGLIAYVLKGLKDKEYTYDRITYDHINEPTKEEFDDFVSTLGLPFTPYDYQLQAAYDSIRHKRLLVGAATGSGKSLIIGLILQWMNKEGRKTLLLVPNILLTNQMKADMKDYFGDTEFTRKIVTIGGDNLLTASEKEYVFDGDSIIISTWQSLYNCPEVIEPIEVLIADEAHGAKSDVYDTLISQAVNCTWRIGLTGTIPRNYADKMSILSVIGKSKVYINPQGLIDRGLATPVFIKTMFFNYTTEDRKIVKALKKYPDEIKFISTHPERNDKLSAIIHKLSTKGNVLVLADKIDHIKELILQAIKRKTGINNVVVADKLTPKFIKECYVEGFKIAYNGNIGDKEKEKVQKIIKKEFDKDFDGEDLFSLQDIGVFIIYGGIDGKQREEIRNVIKDHDEAIIIATYATMSTGANIPKLHYIVLASSTKSFIRLNQTVGRGMRKHESKNKVYIIDIVDDLQYKGPRSTKPNYVYKHFQERLAQYRENGYPISEAEVDLISF